MEYNLTEGNITGNLLKFAFPLMIGNLLQQCYNIADTLIVGCFLGADALAAVGSAYTLMVFLTSIILGLCMGSSAFFSMQFGAGNTERLKKSFFLAFVLIGMITLVLNFLVVWKLDLIIRLLQIPAEIRELIHYYVKFPHLRVEKRHMKWDTSILKEITGLSILTCMQQSIMNLGILMVQGLVNSFGTAVMAAFAAAVKIDSFAYMPVQDFGNAFSTFVAQNFGAGKKDRIHRGTRSAVTVSTVFCLVVSALVFIFAAPLMKIFIEASRPDIIKIGVGYLRIEGSFYFGIGIRFLLYGYYRAVSKPAMSVVLTVISLGTRVVLAYVLSAIPAVGVTGIWMSVPIGWILADATGILYMYKLEKNKR